MKTAIIIPVRLASTRLPNKALLNETGKTLLEHTVDAARQSKLADEVLMVLDKETAKHDIPGWQVVTSDTNRNGTQRAAEALRNNPDLGDIIVNLQVDEPLVTGEMLDKLIEQMYIPRYYDDGTAKSWDGSGLPTIATLVAPRQGLVLPDYNKVGVAVEDGACHWFSRTIASDMDHIGVYAYRREVLLALAKLHQSQLSKAESLEQLDWIVNGYDIAAVEVDEAPLSINTRSDYDQFVKLMKERASV